MGNLHAKPKQDVITDADRAVLSLKTQRRKLTAERKRLEGAVDRELAVAKELVAAQKRERALLALKRRKLHEQRLAQLDAWLLNVEQVLSNIEVAKQQNRLFDALKAGSEAVKSLQQQVAVEDVEKLMEDGAEAQAYQEQLDRVLSQSLSPAEGEVAEAELEQLEADYARLEATEQLPSVPKPVHEPQHGVEVRHLAARAEAANAEQNEAQLEQPLAA